MRRILLTVLPKVLLSRTTGLLTRLPIPGPVRAPCFRWFARRYGVDLDQVRGELHDYPSLASFFTRPLRDGTRPISPEPLLAPCDGRVVNAGPITGDRIPQVKGVDYSLAELVADDQLAKALAGGSQATIYLAPGDYHRVHSPFDGEVLAIRAVRGTLFPVNPPAVRAIDDLFVRNARVVFDARLPDGRAAAIVLVGALNVGDIQRSVEPGTAIRRGDEVGRFGFGSTTIAIVGPGSPSFGTGAPETRVRMGESLTAPRREA